MGYDMWTSIYYKALNTCLNTNAEQRQQQIKQIKQTKSGSILSAEDRMYITFMHLISDYGYDCDTMMSLIELLVKKQHPGNDKSATISRLTPFKSKENGGVSIFRPSEMSHIAYKLGKEKEGGVKEN